MDFSIVNICAMLIFSSVGLIYLRFGKIRGEIRFILVGVILLCYSYFTPTPTLTIVVGILLSILPFLRSV